MGVLAECFFHPPKSQLSGEINVGSKELIDSESSALLADSCRHLPDKFGVKGAAHADGRVKDGGVQRNQTVEAFALDEGRDTWGRSVSRTEGKA